MYEVLIFFKQSRSKIDTFTHPIAKFAEFVVMGDVRCCFEICARPPLSSLVSTDSSKYNAEMTTGSALRERL